MDAKDEPISPIDLLGKADALCVDLLGEAEVIRLARMRQLKIDNPTLYSLVRSRMDVLREIANPKIEVVLVFSDHRQKTFKVPGKEPPKVVLLNNGALIPFVFALRTGNYYDQVVPVFAEQPKPPKV